ncbi:uncharacterized protein L969DRAFT_50559 [Mixia osmundae IAM 14324]|uniref:Uncharacterized protein n=1 Tax=Mixia osmundae (strain CBS 9802 / IAM 14324 / JCM 22182 / KY 12970) TaxID=764103 RepID=G7E116_MIXOS|nr:uncharacterized protein L969DRAFT_50559 [Mixia osmundae IAM 14324]KEI38839.1 hypothetical protein L969DRAFT_50559 [Mixia osmundae IAM 14324]GAA96526.1 hypothetical protein E5Q_03194 [Mixia osmundae IAM 14324]
MWSKIIAIYIVAAWLCLVNALATDRPQIGKSQVCVLSSTLMNGHQKELAFGLFYDTSKEQYSKLTTFASHKPVVEGKTSIIIIFTYSYDGLAYQLEPSLVDGVGLKSWSLKCGGAIVKKA